jgi:5'-3' exonuclease
MLFIVIDGHNFLHRAMNSECWATKTHNNMYIGGVLGCLKTLNYIVHSVPIQKVCVIFVWDGRRSKRRLSLYPEYKGNREHHKDTPSEETLEYFSRFNMQQKLLNDTFLPALGVLSITDTNREGDDVIYLLCSLFRLDNEILVISEDRDMFQLIMHFPNVRVYRPVTKSMVDAKNFEEHALCKLQHYLIYKALKGDASDNITGIPLIGPKTAAKIVSQANPVSPNEFFGWIQAQYGKERAKGKETRISGVFHNWGTYARNLELMDLAREEFSHHEQTVITEAVEKHKVEFFEPYFNQMCKQYGMDNLISDFCTWKAMFP